ncbi:MAG TPA: hypothetical protein VM784_14480 [Actinomycetota bacterium]|nr:hypothetical protein [Actinomycetota bacterium]
MRIVARIFAGPVMILLGLNHFVSPDAYAKIIPPALPAPYALVYISGAAQALGAAGTLHPKTRRAAGWFLIAMLVAIFPANVYMALEPENFPSIPRWALLARLPLQGLFVYLVWRAALADDPAAPRESSW